MKAMDKPSSSPLVAGNAVLEDFDLVILGGGTERPWLRGPSPPKASGSPSSIADT